MYDKTALFIYCRVEKADFSLELAKLNRFIEIYLRMCKYETLITFFFSRLLLRNFF